MSPLKIWQARTLFFTSKYAVGILLCTTVRFSPAISLARLSFWFVSFSFICIGYQKSAVTVNSSFSLFWVFCTFYSIFHSFFLRKTHFQSFFVLRFKKCFVITATHCVLLLFFLNYRGIIALKCCHCQQLICCYQIGYSGRMSLKSVVNHIGMVYRSVRYTFETEW